MFGRIDRNNANWGDVLFGHQISDSGFDIPLTEDAPIVTEAIDDNIHLMPARYRENSANIPRRLRELPFSVLSGFVRLSQHTQECETQSQLSWRTCASLREALPSHRLGLISLVRLARVEKPLQLRACTPTRSLRP